MRQRAGRWSRRSRSSAGAARRRWRADLAATLGVSCRVASGTRTSSNFGVFGSPGAAAGLRSPPTSTSAALRAVRMGRQAAGGQPGGGGTGQRRVAARRDARRVAAALSPRGTARRCASSPPRRRWRSGTPLRRGGRHRPLQSSRWLKKSVVKESESMAAKRQDLERQHPGVWASFRPGRGRRPARDRRQPAAGSSRWVERTPQADERPRHARRYERDHARDLACVDPPAPARPVPADPGGPQGGRVGVVAASAPRRGSWLMEAEDARDDPADATGLAGRIAAGASSPTLGQRFPVTTTRASGWCRASWLMAGGQRDHSSAGSAL